MRRTFLIGAFALAILVPAHARAALSNKDARKAIQTMAGWSLPSDAVRVQEVRSSGNDAAEVSAELQLVFRLRQREGRWQLSEIRVGPDRWEQLETIARAANVELPSGNCDAPAQFARSKAATELNAKRARCLVADLFGVTLPSDAVRVRDISPFGLSMGPEATALVVALVQADFRFARDGKGWRVAEFKSGARDWVNVAGLPAAIDQLKRLRAADETLDHRQGARQLPTRARFLCSFRPPVGAH